ncbi:MAG TPA: disulfide bond formation protein B, partial [Candidatus Latescibacteria bacterium]|nr:disulfide bond formation protein B [Candidatus Latescibacterota bacterium]
HIVYQESSPTHGEPDMEKADAPDPSETGESGSSDEDWMLLFAAWLVVAISALGSLFFSQVMDFAPCILCWYQRIFLFPMVIVLGRALFPLDRHVAKYALPLAMGGWLLAAYHNLLYHGVIPASMQPCTRGVSCTEEYIDLFGFLSIPMLSLLSFTSLIALLIVFRRRSLH